MYQMQLRTFLSISKVQNPDIVRQIAALRQSVSAMVQSQIRDVCEHSFKAFKAGEKAIARVEDRVKTLQRQLIGETIGIAFTAVGAGGLGELLGKIQGIQGIGEDIHAAYIASKDAPGIASKGAAGIGAFIAKKLSTINPVALNDPESSALKLTNLVQTVQDHLKFFKSKVDLKHLVKGLKTIAGIAGVGFALFKL
jgi:hypothetical protein